MRDVVVFDFYNTLAENAHGPWWPEIVAELGYTLDPDAHRALWDGGLDGTAHDEHSRSRDHYVAWQRARTTTMLDASGIPECDHDVLIARMQEVMSSRPITAYDEVAAVLADLRSRGCTLAICSNWDWDLHEAVAQAGLTDAFDVVVSSAWVGARKPHPRIYEHTMRAVEASPERTIFVGDTWACDVAGPMTAGMTPVYLRRPHLGVDHTAPPDADTHPVARATDLTAVLDLIDRVDPAGSPAR